MVSEVEEYLHPKLAPLVTVLLQSEDVGVFGGNIKFSEPKTSRNVRDLRRCCDRFKIHIPYAGNSLTWQVIFDSMYPEDPPDFVFGPGDRDFCPGLEDIKSLVYWNAEDSQSLVLVVAELIQHYKDFQIQNLSNHPGLHNECMSLVEARKFRDVEIHQQQRGIMSWESPVNFLYRLPVDFSEIPEIFTKDCPGEDLAILIVTFQTPDAGKAYPQLYLSPRVENAVGGSSGLRIPAFPSDGSMVTYVPHVCDLLENIVDLIVRGFKKRKEYIAAFLSFYGKSILEYDAEKFDKISFLFEDLDFHFILHINLPTYFPKEQPEFLFQSIYHTTSSGRPYSQSVREYPYSPRWDGVEMAERARSFLEEFLPEFKRASVTSGRFR